MPHFGHFHGYGSVDLVFWHLALVQLILNALLLGLVWRLIFLEYGRREGAIEDRNLGS